MGRVIALCLLPGLLSCLALALGIEVFSLGLSVPCGLVLVAAAVLFAASCAHAFGAALFGHFRRELEKSAGDRKPLDQAQVAQRKTRALQFAAAGACCLALGFVLGGEPLVNVCRFLVTH